MQLYKKYTIGSDPELFIFNTKTKKVVSAIDKIPGTKEVPFKEELPEGFGLQTDNIAAEFNIPAVTNFSDFLSHIEFMKDIIRNRVKEINPDFDILCAASAKVPMKELKHPQAKQFGCQPDYCVYTQEKNPVTAATRTSLRSTGTHIHIGYDNNNIDTSVYMLKYIDAVLGLNSILYDTDTERRKLYGKAGCFRLCSYGFEYRTLSSYWIANASRMEFIWKQLMWALYLCENSLNIPDGATVQHIIDNNDVATAKSIIKKYKLSNPNAIKPE